MGPFVQLYVVVLEKLRQDLVVGALNAGLSTYPGPVAAIVRGKGAHRRQAKAPKLGTFRVRHSDANLVDPVCRLHQRQRPRHFALFAKPVRLDWKKLFLNVARQPKPVAHLHSQGFLPRAAIRDRHLNSLLCMVGPCIPMDVCGVPDSQILPLRRLGHDDNDDPFDATLQAAVHFKELARLLLHNFLVERCETFHLPTAKSVDVDPIALKQGAKLVDPHVICNLYLLLHLVVLAIVVWPLWLRGLWADPSEANRWV
mmetsp:Transcript_15614/g.36849  ORF Transcript_15614/g.36849 Transcript_15614/m.36849 type:complete len:256 (+) Transcript_15614:1740-2507(+)